MWFLSTVHSTYLKRNGQTCHDCIAFFNALAASAISRPSYFDKISIYLSQFNSPAWYSSNIAGNETLCGEGFAGNPDIYGLGVRLGIYLQWLSCLLANHRLPDTRSALAQAYMIFLTAICAAVVVMPVQSTCTFAIEIVILYYMFYGGCLCVFTWPNLTTKEPNSRWLGMTNVRGNTSHF